MSYGGEFLIPDGYERDYLEQQNPHLKSSKELDSWGKSEVDLLEPYSYHQSG